MDLDFSGELCKIHANQVMSVEQKIQEMKKAEIMLSSGLFSVRERGSPAASPFQFR